MFCALLMKAKISGERLQDHWSSGFSYLNTRSRIQELANNLDRKKWRSKDHPKISESTVGILVSPSIGGSVNHVQRSVKPLANQSQISCGSSMGRGNKTLYKWSRSYQMTKKAAYMEETFKTFRTRSPMILELGMKY